MRQMDIYFGVHLSFFIAYDFVRNRIAMARTMST